MCEAYRVIARLDCAFLPFIRALVVIPPGLRSPLVRTC